MKKHKVLSVFLISLTFSGIAVFELAAASETPWMPRTSLPTAIVGLEAAVANEKIYAFKGSITYENDPGAMWTTKSSMPIWRGDVAAATYQNKIYVIGGRANDSSIVGTNQVYDPTNDSWSTLTPMPTPRFGLDANVVEGKIYLISGLIPHHLYPDDKTTAEVTSLNQVYDPTTDSWARKTPIPNTVSFYASAVVDNKIYIISDTLTQIYDPSSDTWTYGASPPYPVDMAGCAATTGEIAPQRIYVIGGRTSGLEVDYNQIYDPATDSWSLGTPIPTARYSLGVAAVDDIIYAFGGLTGAFVVIEQKDQVEQYNPLKDTPMPAPTPSSTPTLPLTPTPTPTAIPSPSVSPSPSSSSSPNLTSSPSIEPSSTIPEFSVWLVLPLLFAVTILLVVVCRRKQVCSSRSFARTKCSLVIVKSTLCGRSVDAS
jgi:hypothetical protein